MDKIASQAIQIFNLVQKTFRDCDLQTQDNLIWIRRGNVVLHTLDFNTLEYYYKTNQLEDKLKEL